MTPRISVIVALDQHAAPQMHVARLLAQTVPDFEAVLVEGTPGRASQALVEREIERAGAAHVHFIGLPACGRAARWNAGIRQTTAPLVLFLGDDFFSRPRLLEEHVALHERRPEPNVCGIGPGVFPPYLPVTPFMRWLEDSGELYGASFTRPDPNVLRRFWYGGNVSLKRDFLQQTGGFCEAFRHAGWDDYEMGLRLFARGMEVVYLPDAVADHEHSITLGERREAMVQAGEAARIFELVRSEAQPRSRLCRRSPAKLWIDEVRRRLDWALRGGERRRERWYRSALDRAFTRGYRAEVRREGR